jgi:hypothetical protein
MKEHLQQCSPLLLFELSLAASYTQSKQAHTKVFLKIEEIEERNQTNQGNCDNSIARTPKTRQLD